ncbi:MAG: hypothetical protein LBV33_01145, partial [Lachnospiraceae bacterium]|nr:hypothetical protein [Lachnospiraceae bacterium]
PIFGLEGGPLTPQLIAGSGTITAFAAEFDCVVACDLSISSILLGIMESINSLIDEVAEELERAIGTLANMTGLLTQLGGVLPDGFEDMIRAIMFPRLNDQLTQASQSIHAVLWHRTDNEVGDAVWNEVVDLNLGPVPWAELAPLNALVATLGDVGAVVDNVADAILSIFGLPEDDDDPIAPSNMPFRAGKAIGLEHAVTAGDYLMVQFTLKGNDFTLLSGVVATNVMASVAIE